ncbi:MAG: hypothetical protein ABSH09_13370 [Bryobacteraceae bacterium]
MTAERPFAPGFRTLNAENWRRELIPIGLQGAAARFLLATAFLLGVHPRKDHRMAGGVTGQPKRQLVDVLLVKHDGPAPEELAQPSLRYRPARQIQQLVVRYRVSIVFRRRRHDTFPSSKFRLHP